MRADWLRVSGAKLGAGAGQPNIQGTPLYFIQTYSDMRLFSFLILVCALLGLVILHASAAPALGRAEPAETVVDGELGHDLEKRAAITTSG